MQAVGCGAATRSRLMRMAAIVLALLLVSSTIRSETAGEEDLAEPKASGVIRVMDI